VPPSALPATRIWRETRSLGAGIDGIARTTGDSEGARLLSLTRGGADFARRDGERWFSESVGSGVIRWFSFFYRLASCPCVATDQIMFVIQQRAYRKQ
jgi:hypothetical protein